MNEQVQANTPVTNEVMNIKEALASGAMALFGEKYGDRVRVVRIGDFSTELCGGTHLEQTGQIGFFKVATEGAVAAGVRRIEAVTGAAAVETVARQERVLREIGDILKISPPEAPQRLRKLLEEQRTLEKQLAELEGKLARSTADDLVAGARQVNGVAVVAGRIDGKRVACDLERQAVGAVVADRRDRITLGVRQLVFARHEEQCSRAECIEREEAAVRVLLGVLAIGGQQESGSDCSLGRKRERSHLLPALAVAERRAVHALASDLH